MAADYAFPFARVTISGTVFNGAEEWSTGFQFGSETEGIVELQSGGAALIAARWKTFMENGAHQISNAWRVTEVKVALINTNGTTDVDNIDYYNYPTVVTGGQGGTPWVPQITLAATMTSEYQRGLASKGRMYLPGVNSGIDAATGKLGAAFTNTLNTGFKTFLDGVNQDEIGPGYIIIASKGHKTNALDENGHPVYENGRNARVTGCRIGDVYETQRRRRNGLAETYNTKVLA